MNIRAIRYQLPVILNTTPTLILDKIFTHRRRLFTLYIKNMYKKVLRIVSIEEYNAECENLFFKTILTELFS